MPQALGFVSFNAGEWSPRMLGRYDQPKYPAAALRCSNFLPLVMGPITRRPGTQHKATVRGNTASVLFIPFVFSTEQAYVIEATPLKFRFFRDRAPVVEASKTITAITKANPAVVTSNGHGFNNGDELVLSGIGGMVELNNRRAIVAGRTTNTFQLKDLDGNNINSTGYGTFTSGGNAARVYELTTTYTADDLALLSYDQSADVLYIGCLGKKPRKLTRLGDANWTLADITFTDGPYLPENSTDNEAGFEDNDGSPIGTSVQIEWQNTQGINGGAGFTSSDIGRYVRLLRRLTSDADDTETTWAWFQITAIVNSRRVTATAKTRTGYNPSGLYMRRWRLGAWSDTLGWPSMVVLFQGRVLWGVSAAQPLTLWWSESDQFESFAPTPLFIAAVPAEATPSNAFFLTFVGGQRNQLKWLLPLTYLAVGSGGDERSVRGGDLSEIVAFDNAAVRNASDVGSCAHKPARVNSSAVFISAEQRRLHELAYASDAQNYVEDDLTRFAEHLGQESGYAQVVFQRRPWRVLWVRRQDGSLVALTYDREQDMIAAHRHPLGGTAVRVLAMACIPGQGQDELWLAVERTINGTTRRHVEVLSDEQLLGQADARNFVYLDASLTYSGASVPAGDRFFGLEHLVGETVQVLADGATHQDVVVQAPGTITLERAASVVHAGYHYDSLFKSVPIEAGNPSGSSVGRPKTLHRLTLYMIETIGGRAGPTEAKTELMPARMGNDAMDTAPPLRSGRKNIAWSGSMTDDALSLVVIQDKPFPMTLAGAVPAYSVNEA